MKDNRIEIYELLEEVLLEKEIGKKDELIMGLMLDVEKIYKIINKDIDNDSVVIKINKEDGLVMNVLGNFNFNKMMEIAILLAKAGGSFLALPYESFRKSIIVEGVINDANEEEFVKIIEEIKDSFIERFIKSFKESFLEEIKKGE